MEDEVFIGNREVWGGLQPFGMSRTDRRQHLYTIGRTGIGESTMLRNVILNDIEAGCGVGIIDPQGRFAADILDPATESWDALV